MKHRRLTLALLLLAASAAYVCPRLVTSAAGGAEPAEPRQQRRRTRVQNPARRPPAKDYSTFRHSTPAHQKDSCDSCHRTPSDNWARVRDRGSAFFDVTDYPEHESCLGCHRAQFFKGDRPVICSICHSVVSPRSGDRHPFQNPPAAFARSPKARKYAAGGDEFALNFPHDLHLDAMAANRPGAGRTANSCRVCHDTLFLRAPAKPAEAKPADARPASAASAVALEDGLLMTSPTGHESCFNCHWKGSGEREGGEKPYASDCKGCHTPLQGGAAATTRAPAPPPGKDIGRAAAEGTGFIDPSAISKLLRRQSVKFAHSDDNHKGLDCAVCHVRVSSADSLGPATFEVPILSCGGSKCHIDERTNRTLNDEMAKRRADPAFQCTHCHVGYAGAERPPASHLRAVGAPVGR